MHSELTRTKPEMILSSFFPMFRMQKKIIRVSNNTSGILWIPMSWCKERLWPQLMRLKLVNGSVNRMMLHCQCCHLRAAKLALTALLRKHPEVKHLKQIINSLIKLAQTTQAAPAVSFNHSYIEVWGFLIKESVFNMFFF